MLKVRLKTYLKNSTIHGCSYISNEQCHIYERFKNILKTNKVNWFLFKGFLVDCSFCVTNSDWFVDTETDCTLSENSNNLKNRWKSNWGDNDLFSCSHSLSWFETWLRGRYRWVWFLYNKKPTSKWRHWIEGSDFAGVSFLFFLGSHVRDLCRLCFKIIFLYYLIYFSLKYLQIVSLTTDDDFLNDYNVSIPTDDLVDILKKFPKLIYTINTYQLNILHAWWGKFFQAVFTETLGPKGICWTFNFPGASKLFNLEK